MTKDIRCCGCLGCPIFDKCVDEDRPLCNMALLSLGVHDSAELDNLVVRLVEKEESR